MRAGEVRLARCTAGEVRKVERCGERRSGLGLRRPRRRVPTGLGLRGPRRRVPTGDGCGTTGTRACQSTAPRVFCQRQFVQGKRTEPSLSKTGLPPSGTSLMTRVSTST